MRLLHLTLAAAVIAGLGACSSTESGRGSGLAETFSLDNYRASSNTNGTQTRRDVNRAYRQPSLPNIAHRGM